MSKVICIMLDIFKEVDAQNYNGMSSMFASEKKYREHTVKQLSKHNDLLIEFLNLIERADTTNEYVDAVEAIRLIVGIDKITTSL